MTQGGIKNAGLVWKCNSNIKKNDQKFNLRHTWDTAQTAKHRMQTLYVFYTFIEVSER